MLTTVEGIYRNGQVELAEPPKQEEEGARVLVTFLHPRPVDLRERGIDEAEAATLQSRLASFAQDWDSPEMAAYDDYESARAHL
jgi:hypothetical protein